MGKRVYAVKEVKRLIASAQDTPTAMGGGALLTSTAHALNGPEHTGQLPVTRLSTVATDTTLVLLPDGSGGVEFGAITAIDGGGP